MDGIHAFRVAASVAVVTFHGFLYWAAAGEETAEEKIDMVNQSWFLKLVSFANLGVDGLLVLSGFLAGRSFLAQREDAPFSLVGYLKKKHARILVPYWILLVTIGLSIRGRSEFFDPIFGYCPGTLPLSPVLLNNFIGFGGCGVHLWSVAVQMHLFVLFGVLSALCGPGDTGRRRMTVLAWTAFLAGVAGRVALARWFGSKFPPPPFDHPLLSQESQDEAFYFYHPLYFATPARVTNFATGVLLALSWSNGWTQAAVPLVAGAVTSGYIALLTSVDYRGGRWGAMGSALIFHGSPTASAVAALLLAAAIARGRSTPLIRWLSDRTFAIYLWHPLVMRMVSEAARR